MSPLEPALAGALQRTPHHVSDSADSQTLLLRGEVVEVALTSGRRTLTVALEPHGIHASAGIPEDIHLGDRVRVEAEIRVVHVVPELPEEIRPPARRIPRPPQEET